MISERQKTWRSNPIGRWTKDKRSVQVLGSNGGNQVGRDFWRGHCSVDLRVGGFPRFLCVWRHRAFAGESPHPFSKAVGKQNRTGPQRATPERFRWGAGLSPYKTPLRPKSCTLRLSAVHLPTWFDCQVFFSKNLKKWIF